MSRKPAQGKTGHDITEAVQRTELLIRGLQTRLADQPHAESPEIESPEIETPEPEREDDLEFQLQKYFTDHQGPDSPVNRIKQRVIEGVVEKLLAEWAKDGTAAAIEREIAEALIDRVSERLRPTLRATKLSA